MQVAVLMAPQTPAMQGYGNIHLKHGMVWISSIDEMCCWGTLHLSICPVHIPLLGNIVALSGKKLGQRLARDDSTFFRGLQSTRTRCVISKMSSRTAV